MLWAKAFHIIFVICWYAGLFYLPRLFVYHTQATSPDMNARFSLMERRLYWWIMTPSAILAVGFGFWMWYVRRDYYDTQAWMHAKLLCVDMLIIYHVYCGVFVRRFRLGINRYSTTFYRWINEIPTVFLILIVIMAVVQP